MNLKVYTVYICLGYGPCKHDEEPLGSIKCKLFIYIVVL